jgi:hypothetical protein
VSNPARLSRASLEEGFMKISRIALMLPALCFLILLFGSSAWAAETGVAVLQTFTPPAQVLRAGAPISLFPGIPLVPGDKVTTGDNGKAEVYFSDGTRLKVGPNTDVNIEQSAEKKKRSIKLLFGRIASIVTPSKEMSTEFVAGNTVAAIRGTFLEQERRRLDGFIRLGSVDGQICLNVPLGQQVATVCITGGQSTSAWPGQGPTNPVPFHVGDIFGEHAFPDYKPSPPPPPPPPPPTGEEGGEEGGTGLPTQGYFALTILRDTGLDNRLPDNATERDATEFLQKYGITPCKGYWEVDKPLKWEDYCAITTGECKSDCELLSPDEMKKKLLNTYPELFWLIIQPRQTVSPFAP